MNRHIGVTVILRGRSLYSLRGIDLTLVRFATVDEFEKLLNCYLKIFESLHEFLPDSFVDPELESVRTSEGMERFKQGIESKDGIFLVAEENNEIAGLASGRAYAGLCNLGFLGVRREYRRKKVGASLLSKFIEEARNRKAHKIWLYTSPSLLPAIRLYVGSGFVPEGFLRKHTYGVDLIIYSKFLE